ncbi:MAG: hypothetical protein RLZZ196_1773 [Bacteroidota bacterium]
MYHQCNLTEGLELNDLKRLVFPNLGIDNYKSKMGDDADIIVLNFTVDGKSPAKDLMTFLERGYDFVADADISSGEDDEGNWLVFAEIDRNRQAPKLIIKMLEDILNLTDQKLDEWVFTYHKDKTDYPMSIESIEAQVPLSPKLYRERFGDKDMDQLKESARVPMNKKAPSNYYTDTLRIAAGLK